MSFRQHSFDTQVVNLKTPTIQVMPLALSDMWEITDLHTAEIGWLGAVRLLDRSTFLIEEVFLVEQGAHAATTEIDPSGLAKLAQELLVERTDGADLLNRIRFWGHSHVNMGLTPSGQDDKQLRQLAADAEDYFLAARTNKRREMRIDLLRGDGLLVTDIPWEVYAPTDSRRTHWEAEIKAKVRNLSLPTYSNAGRRPHTQAAYGGSWNHDSYEWGSVGRNDPPDLPARRTATLVTTKSTAHGDRTPKRIDTLRGTYLNHLGQEQPLEQITDEEILLAGYMFVDEQEYQRMEMYDDVEDAFWDADAQGYWVLEDLSLYNIDEDEPPARPKVNTKGGRKKKGANRI